MRAHALWPQLDNAPKKESVLQKQKTHQHDGVVTRKYLCNRKLRTRVPTREYLAMCRVHDG